MSEKARPTFVSIAKQIESLTPKTQRAERGFSYEMRKLKMLVRTELQIARGEAQRRAHILRASLTAGSPHQAMLGPLLEIADSTMTYRRRYFAEPQLTPVLDLLVADSTNARSLAFQVVQLADHVNQLPRDQAAPSPAQEQRIVTHLSEAIAGADLDAMGQPEADGSLPSIDALLDTIADDLRRLSDTVTFYYFSHAEVRVG